MTTARQACLLLMLLLAATLTACGEDETPEAPPGPAVGKVAGNVAFFQSIEIQLRGYPRGAQLVLRPGIYWSPSQLLEDPQPVVTRLAEASFRLEFGNLDPGVFGAPEAEILLVVVDSSGDELSGVVVLCSDQGPIALDPSCAGDCVPDCGLPGTACDG